MRSLKIQMLGLVRYLRPDRNPLRRPLDRTHSRLIAMLATLFLITAGVVTAAAVHFVGAAGLRAERQQALVRHQTDAVIIGLTEGGSRNGFVQSTRLQWRDARGTVHTGTVTQRNDDRVGAHRTVWIDRAGDLTVRPRTHVQTITDTAMAALTGLTTLLLLHAGAYALVNQRLDRRRMALWEAEWAAIAPRWTGRS